ncbi:hypothetical protein ANCCAN_01004 [Ancylostoma caninum]|uniref:Mitochondrial mRNA-processing protein COX24 C-terminal domain-containing protein n=1 Tax=Ancylostoma caninum TaxID=29170 RepID=A0A368HCG7_ANCCA|nr:hypothetical protein ANCCAN_01004 [Ancylostoma caninum]
MQLTAEQAAEMNSLLTLTLASFLIVTVLSAAPKGKCIPSSINGIPQLSPVPLPSAAVSNNPQKVEAYRRRMNKLRLKAWKAKLVKKHKNKRRRVVKKKH